MVISYGLSMVLFVIGVWISRKEKKMLMNQRVSVVFQPDQLKNEEAEDQKSSFTKRIVDPIWKKLKRNYQKNLSNEQKVAIEQKLLQAGNPLGMTPVEFRIVQLGALLLIPGSVLFVGVVGNIPPGLLVFAVALSIIGGRYLPLMYLKGKARERNQQALRELPDFLDLVTVSIEAGLGFDGALSKVVAKKDGILSMEFQRCLEEMRLGKTRREALTGVRNRLMLDDVRTLIGSIIQAEQLGIGMVQVMRVQSNEIRQKRKQRAEEAAMKAPIKMLFPLIIFIFPCIFIVLLGPAVIRFLDFF